ncbi:outer membrane beta-barrel protein [Bdellovibrio svalbardensis]|uniref:Outer membrane beta-barrel protein n=1 Tax=Bdellovibrio svalbardensis TaxID=2972972 RepID=A0ABT6DE86_9BACT|nr:outer membrane beta-barrel protein [Bdellovibrio svalbardensis]MDG0814839.1 outer membrane beta-barrel protein [Bdellovibrio svalbardensis]
MKSFLLSFSLVLSSIFMPLHLVQAQAKNPTGGQTNAQNTYISAVDQDLAIKSLVLVPTTDNVGGIYAKPIDEELRKLLNDDKQWSLSEFPKDLKIKSELLDEHPEDVKKILQAGASEAALTSKLIKGPRGISITLTLFVGREGLPLLQENIADYKGFEIGDIKSQVANLFMNLKNRMPFRATILSRRGQQVTLNLGSNYGLKSGNRVSVVQIIKINRHPKLNFMVSTDKEVLGRVKLFKVEPYLSFGYVELEKESGVIAVGSKVMPDEFVKYSLPVTTPSGKVMQDITQRPDKDVAFGDEPKEWVPESAPQFGKVELMAGFSNYTQNAKLQTAGSISGSNNLSPNILVRAELWINPEWFVGVNLRQSVFSIDNGYSGSSPGKLNMSVSQYGVNGGYNFLLSNDFFGPKIRLNAGFSSTDFKVDDSTPTAFTSMKYSGLLLGIEGQFPLSDELPIDLGGKFDLYVNPSLSESKSSGASSSNTINAFSFFMDYRLKTRFKIRGELLFENYSSSFSGAGQRSDPASSISHKMTTLMGGIQYLF